MTDQKEDKAAFQIIIGVLFVNPFQIQQNVAHKSQGTAHNDQRAILGSIGVILDHSKHRRQHKEQTGHGFENQVSNRVPTGADKDEGQRNGHADAHSNVISHYESPLLI